MSSIESTIVPDTVQLIVDVAGLCSRAPALEVMRPAGTAPWASAQTKRPYQCAPASSVVSTSASARATREKVSWTEPSTGCPSLVFRRYFLSQMSSEVSCSGNLPSAEAAAREAVSSVNESSPASFEAVVERALRASRSVGVIGGESSRWAGGGRGPRASPRRRDRPEHGSRQEARCGRSGWSAEVAGRVRKGVGGGGAGRLRGGSG